jgi:hypothetical protein
VLHLVGRFASTVAPAAAPSSLIASRREICFVSLSLGGVPSNQ